MIWWCPVHHAEFDLERGYCLVYAVWFEAAPYEGGSIDVTECEKVEALLIVKENVTREWRCWREDGTYHGPCTPPPDDPQWLANGGSVGGQWAWEHKNEQWREGRHGDCGWQLYVMEDALASVGGDSQ